MSLDLLNKIKEEVAAGNVKEQRHPNLPLSIFKYTKTCVYAAIWKEIEPENSRSGMGEKTVDKVIK